MLGLKKIVGQKKKLGLQNLGHTIRQFWPTLIFLIFDNFFLGTIFYFFWGGGGQKIQKSVWPIFSPFQAILNHFHLFRFDKKFVKQLSS